MYETTTVWGIICSAEEDSALYVKHSWIQIMAVDYTANIGLHQTKMKFKGGDVILEMEEWQ